MVVGKVRVSVSGAWTPSEELSGFRLSSTTPCGELSRRLNFILDRAKKSIQDPIVEGVPHEEGAMKCGQAIDEMRKGAL